jgi:hypothetical protein
MTLILNIYPYTLKMTMEYISCRDEDVVTKLFLAYFPYFEKTKVGL